MPEPSKDSSVAVENGHEFEKLIDRRALRLALQDIFDLGVRPRRLPDLQFAGNLPEAGFASAEMQLLQGGFEALGGLRCRPRG
jgi:hypothetical protein